MCFLCMEPIFFYFGDVFNTTNEPSSTPPHLLFVSGTSCMGNGFLTGVQLNAKMEDDYKKMALFHGTGRPPLSVT